MKYAVSEEGVQALYTLGRALGVAADDIVTKAKELKNAGNIANIGPHAQSLIEAGEAIEHAIQEAAGPIEEIMDTIIEVAEGYEEVISNDRVRAAVDGGSDSQGGAGYGSGGSGASGSGASGGRAWGDYETKFEKEPMDHGERSGEFGPAYGAPNADAWDSLKDVPFAGGSGNSAGASGSVISVTKDELEGIINSSSKEELEQIKSGLQSGRIIVISSDPDDDPPPVKVKVKSRHR